jgi:hypothetical protein
MWPLLANTLGLELPTVDLLIADHSNSQSSDTTPPTDVSWASRWTHEAVQPWLRALVTVHERALYVYGASRSGKTFLVDNLCAQWGKQAACLVLRLNIKLILDASRTQASARIVHEAILSTLSWQIAACHWKQSHPVFDFVSELNEIFVRAPEGKILLVVEAADAAIRTADPGGENYGIDATSVLYDTLKSVIDSSRPSLRRIQAIFTGSRPAAELEEAYERSPFNGARIFVLKRFSEDECIELCQSAGINVLSDAQKVYRDTGGHRSLVWALLSEASLSDRPDEVLRNDLLELAMVQITSAKLLSDLSTRPLLKKAFADVLVGQPVDGEQATLLKDAMLAVATADKKLQCQCPLFEEYFHLSAAALSAPK